MILSLKHRFVFIKGLKVASTSIEMALCVHCGPQDIVTPITPVDEAERLALGGTCRNYSDAPAFEAAYREIVRRGDPAELAVLRPPRGRFYNHISLAEVCAGYGAPLADFTIVCAERSPYEKVISWLNMSRGYARYRRGVAMQAPLSLLEADLDRALERGDVRAVRNIDRYRWPDGRLTAQVLHYETLRRDFAAFLRQIGIAQPVSLPHAKKGVLAGGIDPRSVFRADQIAALNALFADEFEAFGYPML